MTNRELRFFLFRPPSLEDDVDMDKKSVFREYGEGRENLRIQVSKVSDFVDMGPKFSKAVSIDHLLSMIVKQTLDVTNTEVCIIWLKDKNGNLIPSISFGLKTKLIRSLKIRFASKMVRCIMKKPEPVTIYNMSRATKSPLKNLIMKEKLASLLAAPLIVGQERIGVIMVMTRSKHHFSEVDTKIFNALSRQAALGIGNVKLYDFADRRVKEKIKEMSALFTMSHYASESVDLDLILNVILEKTRMLLKAHSCVLRMLDSSRKHTVAVTSGLTQKGFRALSKFEIELSARVMRSGFPLVIPDIQSHDKTKASKFIRRRGIHSLIMVPLYSKRRKNGVLSVFMPEVRIFEKETIEMVEMIANLCAMSIDNSAMLERIQKDYLNSIKMLAKIIDANDTYTRGHCEKVMRYSLYICKKMGVPERYTEAVKTASLLHDIGKVGIDLNIIRKRGSLSKKDWSRVRLHPEIGAKIVSQIGFLNEIVPIIRHHHARYGGGGYPESRVLGDKIPLGSRIIAVADAFDAMTSDRPYRKAVSRKEAIQELRRCSGKQFDPKVVKIFSN